MNLLLKHVDSQFLSFAKDVATSVLIIDGEGTILFANPWLCKLLKYDRKAVEERNLFTSLVPHSDRELSFQLFKGMIRRDSQNILRFPLATFSGEVKYMEWNLTHIKDTFGRKFAFVLLGFDLTPISKYENELKAFHENFKVRSAELEKQNTFLEDTKKAMLNILEDEKSLQDALKRAKAGVEQQVVERTKELNEQKARLISAINAVPSAFMLFDLSGNLLLTNTPFQEILGPKAPKTNVVDIQRYIKVVPTLEGSLIACVRDKKEFVLKDILFGAKFLKIFMAPIVLENLKDSAIGAVVLIEDVTEATNLERSKDEFLSIASHELRTPLTVVRGNSEILSKHFGDKIKDKNFKEILEDIHSSAKRMINMVDDFLTTSRLEQGKMIFERKSCSLKTIAEKALEEFKAIIKEKGLKAKFDADADIVINSDQDRIYEVITNLISNAVKFTDKGTITLKLTKDNGYAKILVIDTGRGIPDESKHLLFRKFQQASSNIYAKDTSSVGLGLYIARLMSEIMGGKVNLLKSEVDKGSTFEVLLPLQ